MTNKIFRFEVEGDTIYIQAPDKDAARKRLFIFTGEIPDSLLTWSEVDSLPEGEEFL